MEEISAGIYRMKLQSTSPDTSVINIYLIPGGADGRVLMIDAGYRSPENKETVTRELEAMGISCDKLDVFLTHKHHDHTGLANYYHDRGARIFMNQDEDRHPYDCLYHNNTPEAMIEQDRVLATVGVNAARTPRLYKRFLDWNWEIHSSQTNMFEESKAYEYTPLTEGMRFDYGPYHFQTVGLKGHTFAQMGLFDEDHKIVFAADQIINGIVPIVGTAYLHDNLLDAYLTSVREFPARFAGYTVYPSHFEPFDNLQQVADKIVASYEKKIARSLEILEKHPGKDFLTGMTVREVAFLTYGIEDEYGWESMFQTKMIITKTFSCLEYLRYHGLARVEQAILDEDQGILFWKPAERRKQ